MDENELILEWNKVFDNCEYIIEKGDSGAFQELVHIYNSNITKLTITNLSCGLEHYYRVRFINKDTREDIAEPEKFFCFVRGNNYKVYKHPAPVIEQIVFDGEKVIIKWLGDFCDSYFLISRKCVGSGWVRIGITKNFFFKDLSVERGSKYSYAIRRITADGHTILSGLLPRTINT